MNSFNFNLSRNGLEIDPICLKKYDDGIVCFNVYAEDWLREIKYLRLFAIPQIHRSRALK